MGINSTKIAVVCNYELLPERVGGMDYFFWMFNDKCKINNIEVDWFFPNATTYGNYTNLKIISSDYQNVEHFFANFITNNFQDYISITTHFVEVCSPIFKKIKQVSKAKIIVVDHNPRPIDGYSFRKKTVKKIKGILFSRYIDLFVGVSNYTVNEILKDFGSHLKSKTITIYNGVLLNSIIVRNERNFINPKFIVVSHLRKSKGIQDLIEAVSNTTNEIQSKLKITIYGDGPYKNELLEKMYHHKLQTVFEFKGSVSNLKEVYNNYDYMLQPTHMECFSLSILESLAANVPVITTNVGGNEEVITNFENGIIYKAKDVFALKTIIEKIMVSEIKITSNTRNLIEEKFSLEKMVYNYINIIK